MGVLIKEPYTPPLVMVNVPPRLSRRTAKDAAKRIKAQFAPELIEHPDVAQCQGGFELELGNGRIRRRITAGLEQGAHQLVDLAVMFIHAPQGEQVALAGLPVGIAKGFDDLGIAVTAAAGDFDEHAASVAEPSWTMKLHQE